MIMISDEVQLREGGPAMIVTGYASGMVECRWYDGLASGVKRFARRSCVFRASHQRSWQANALTGRIISSRYFHESEQLLISIGGSHW